MGINVTVRSLNYVYSSRMIFRLYHLVAFPKLSSSDFIYIKGATASFTVVKLPFAMSICCLFFTP